MISTLQRNPLDSNHKLSPANSYLKSSSCGGRQSQIRGLAVVDRAPLVLVGWGLNSLSKSWLRTVGSSPNGLIEACWLRHLAGWN